MKLQQEPKGPDQGYVYSDLCHGVFKTHSLYPGSESITGPSPEDRVTAGGDQWPSPGFTKITRSLWGDDPPCKVMGISPEPGEEQGPIWIAGSTMFSTQLLQDSMSGATHIDMVTCSLSLVGLGVILSVVDHPMPTLLGKGDTDSD